MSNPDPDNAPEPRVESPYTDRVRKLAYMFLLLACRYDHPRQWSLIIDYMIAGDGFDLAHTVRVRRKRVFDDLARLADQLVELGARSRLEHWGSWHDELDELMSDEGGSSHE